MTEAQTAPWRDGVCWEEGGSKCRGGGGHRGLSSADDTVRERDTGTSMFSSQAAHQQSSFWESSRLLEDGMCCLNMESNFKSTPRTQVRCCALKLGKTLS